MNRLTNLLTVRLARTKSTNKMCWMIFNEPMKGMNYYFLHNPTTEKMGGLTFTESTDRQTGSIKLV